MDKTSIGLSETTIHKCYASDDFYRWDNVPNLFTVASLAGDAAADGSGWVTAVVPGGTWATDRGVLTGVDGTIYYDNAQSDYVVSAQVRTITGGDDYDKVGSVVFMYVDDDNFVYTGVGTDGKFFVDYVIAGVDSKFYNSTTTYDVDAWHTIAIRVSNYAQYSIFLDGELMFEYSFNGLEEATYCGLRAYECTAYFARFAMFAYGSEYSDWVTTNLTVSEPSEAVSANTVAIPGRWGGVAQSGRSEGVKRTLSGLLVQNKTDVNRGQNIPTQVMNQSPVTRRRPGYRDTYAISNGDSTYSTYYNTKLLTYAGSTGPYVYVRLARGYGTDSGDRVYVNCDADYSDIYFTDTSLNEIKYYINTYNDLYAIVFLVGEDDFVSGDQILLHYGGSDDTIAHDINVPLREMYDTDFSGSLLGSWRMDNVNGSGDIVDDVGSNDMTLYQESILEYTPPLSANVSTTLFTKSQFGNFLRLTSNSTTNEHKASIAVTGTTTDTPIRVTFKCDSPDEDFTTARLYIEDGIGGSAYWNLYFQSDILTTYEVLPSSPDSGSVDESQIDNIYLSFVSSAASGYVVDYYSVTYGLTPSPGVFSYYGTDFNETQSATLIPVSGVGGSNVPFRITLHTATGTSSGNDVYGVESNFEWCDVLFTDANYNRVPFYLESFDLEEATFVVWFPTLDGTSGAGINVHYAGSTALRFDDSVPIPNYADISGNLLSSYDFFKTVNYYPTSTELTSLDGGDALTNWSVDSPNAGDALSIVSSFTGVGSAIRLTMVTGLNRYLTLTRENLTIGSDAIDLHWRINVQTGLPVTSVPGTLRIEQGTAWAEWEVDYPVGVTTIMDFTLASPDDSSGTIDYDSAVTMEFESYKRAGGGATFDIDEVYVINSVEDEDHVTFVNVLQPGIYDAEIQPQTEFPAIPTPPAPYSYTNPTLGRNIIVDASGSGDYTTLADAVTASADGDILEIIGNYTESLVISKKIKLLGDGTNSITNAGNVIAFSGNNGATLENLTLIGTSTSNVVTFNSGSLTNPLHIKNCTIQSANAIAVITYRLLYVEGCNISGNGGVGLHIAQPLSNQFVVDSTINTVNMAGASNVLFYNNTITTLTIGAYPVQIDDNVITTISAGAGSTVYVYPGNTIGSITGTGNVYVATIPGDKTTVDVAGPGTSFTAAYNQYVVADMSTGVVYTYADGALHKDIKYPEIPAEPTPYTYDGSVRVADPTNDRSYPYEAPPSAYTYSGDTYYVKSMGTVPSHTYSGSTITVNAGGGADYTDIMTAMNNASDGDIIDVQDAQTLTYSKYLTMSLKFISSTGAGSISCGSNGIYSGNNNYYLTFDNVDLTFTTSYLVSEYSSVVEITDCIITSAVIGGTVVSSGGDIVFNSGSIANTSASTSSACIQISTGTLYALGGTLNATTGSNILNVNGVAYIDGVTFEGTKKINTGTGYYSYIYHGTVLTGVTFTGSGTYYTDCFNTIALAVADADVGSGDILDILDAQTVTAQISISKNIKIYTSVSGSITISSGLTYGIIINNGYTVTIDIDITKSDSYVIRNAGTFFFDGYINNGTSGYTIRNDGTMVFTGDIDTGNYALRVGGPSAKTYLTGGTITTTDAPLYIWYGDTYVDGTIFDSGGRIAWVSGYSGGTVHLMSESGADEIAYNTNVGTTFVYYGITTPATISGSGTTHIATHSNDESADAYYPTIAEAVAACSDGDIVKVGGTHEYTGALNIANSIELTSTINDDGSLIRTDGTASTDYAVLINVSGKSVKIENLSISGKTGIYKSVDSDVIINDCEITAQFNGIWIGNKCLIMDSEIIANVGIYADSTTSILFSNDNTISSVSYSVDMARGIYIQDGGSVPSLQLRSLMPSVAHIINSTVDMTVSLQTGAIMYIYENLMSDISDWTITGTGATYVPSGYFNVLYGEDYEIGPIYTDDADIYFAFVTDTELDDTTISEIEAYLAMVTGSATGSWLNTVWPYGVGLMPVSGGGTRLFDSDYDQYTMFDLETGLSGEDVWITAVVKIPYLYDAGGADEQLLRFGNLTLYNNSTGLKLSTTDASVQGGAINDGVAHFVGIQFLSGDQIKLYVDDSAPVTVSTAVTDMSSPATGQIGGYMTMASFFNIYGTGELTDAEFAAIGVELLENADTYSGTASFYSQIPEVGIRSNFEDFLRYYSGDMLRVLHPGAEFTGLFPNVSPPKYEPNSGLKVAKFSISVDEHNLNGVDE